MAPGARNLMIFGPIACFRRPGSRFSGQNRPRSSEMRVYIKNKKSSKFQNLILVPGVRTKRFLRFFCSFFTRKIRNTRISSETTIPGISSETGAIGPPGEPIMNRRRQKVTSWTLYGPKGPAQKSVQGCPCGDLNDSFEVYTQLAQS